MYSLEKRTEKLAADRDPPRHGAPTRVAVHMAEGGPRFRACAAGGKKHHPKKRSRERGKASTYARAYVHTRTYVAVRTCTYVPVRTYVAVRTCTYVPVRTYVAVRTWASFRVFGRTFWREVTFFQSRKRVRQEGTRAAWREARGAVWAHTTAVGPDEVWKSFSRNIFF